MITQPLPSLRSLILFFVLRAVTLLVALAGCRACDKNPAREEAAPPCLAARGPFTGKATHYAADGKGNCSFDADPSRMVAAMNHTDYTDAVWCGACVEVTGPEGAVVVRIVDSCRGCARGDLDLSREAFERISPLKAGRIPISWREVACDVDGPIAYRFKDRSSRHWTGIQVRNHRHAIATLEVRDDTGAYRSIKRSDYNYFVDDRGMGPGPYTLRVTDARGNVVEDSAIELGGDRSGSAQLPACPN